jgi:hypothetical protein
MIFASMPAPAATRGAMLGLALAVALLSLLIDVVFRMHLTDEGGING